MAVKLRLRREGAVKRPHFRVVATDSRAPRNGRFIEIIGEYHPMEEPSGIRIDEERALHWLRHGAQPTAAVEKLLRIVGVWEQFKPGDEPARVRDAAKPRLSKKARAKAAEAAEAAQADNAVEDADDEASTEDAGEADSDDTATKDEA
ncbi:MAG: 30S ribosomal protein S16 [Nitriliruptoraceae bacterium]